MDSRSVSPETVFSNDFPDLEDENEENCISDSLVSDIATGESFGIKDTCESVSDDLASSRDKADKQTTLAEKVEIDGERQQQNPLDGAAGNTSPDIFSDQTKSLKDVTEDTQDTDVARKAEGSTNNANLYINILTSEWELNEEDLLCVPLVLKPQNVDRPTVSLDRQLTGKGRKRNVRMGKFRKGSGKGSSRSIYRYISPLTMIAEFAKKKGYDLPAFMETSEWNGAPSFQLPCMQCYEKYGGKGGTGVSSMMYDMDGMDSMMATLSGEGSTSNGKCLTCGGQVQTLASFGRMIGQMRETIEKKGLVPHDVYPDGNCMFSAIEDQLRVRGDFSFTTGTLREYAVNYLRKNPTADDGTPLAMFLTDEETWETYLSRMGEDGEWGDHMILSALANVVNMPIVIYGGTTGQRETILYPKNMTNENVVSETDVKALDDGHVVYLGHVSESHYMSLRPKDWRKNLQKGLIKRRQSLNPVPSEDSWAKCPLQHISFILRQVFRMELIKSYLSELVDILVPSRWESEEVIKETFGSVICKLVPVKLELDSVGPDVSMFFPSVKEEEKIESCFQNVALTVFFTPNDTDIVPKEASAKQADLIAENATVLGHLKLIPKNQKLWRGQTKLKENITYLKAFEVNFDSSEEPFQAKLFEDSADTYKLLAFQCAWPDVAKQWAHRHRESGFPDVHTIQAVVDSGCHVIPLSLDTRMSDIVDDPIYFMTSVDDHTWCYSFTAAEKEICRFLSCEQRQSFLIFKALVDITLKDIPLPPSIVKSVFFYACENIKQPFWKSNPGECFLLLLMKMVECLKNRHVSHFFIPEKNLMNFIPEETVDECYDRLECVRLQPVVTLYFLLDQLNIMSSEVGCFVEEIIENINFDSGNSKEVKLTKQTILNACNDLLKDFIAQEDYRAAMLVFLDIVEEEGRCLKKDGADILKKVIWDLHIGYLWCFALYFDIKQSTTLTAQLCEGYVTVPLTDVFGPDCTKELPDTVVPECFSISSGDLTFADKVYEVLLQAVSGRTLIKCVKYYLKKYAELAGESLVLPHSDSLDAVNTSSRMTSKSAVTMASLMSSTSSLYYLNGIYVKLFNFCERSNMVEEFREMMQTCSLIAESIGSRISLSNIRKMRECLGESNMPEKARGKKGEGKKGSGFFKLLVGSFLPDYEPE